MQNIEAFAIFRFVCPVYAYRNSSIFEIRALVCTLYIYIYRSMNADRTKQQKQQRRRRPVAMAATEQKKAHQTI